MVKAYPAWVISVAALLFVVSAHGQGQVPADAVPQATPGVTTPATQPSPQPSAPIRETLPQPSATQSATPVPATEACVSKKEGLVLLQRMDEVLNHVKSDEGRSLKGAGVVMIERADLDEVKSEIDQLKAMLGT